MLGRLSKLFSQKRGKEEESQTEVSRSQKPPELNLAASSENWDNCPAEESGKSSSITAAPQGISPDHSIENSWPKGETPIPYQEGKAPRNQYEEGRVIDLNKPIPAYSLMEGGGILGSFSVSGSGIIKKMGEDQWALDLVALGRFPMEAHGEIFPAASARLIVDGKPFGAEIPLRVEGDMIWGGDQKPFGRAMIPLPHYGKTVEIALDYNYMIKTTRGSSAGRSMLGHMVKNILTPGPPIPSTRYSLFP